MRESIHTVGGGFAYARQRLPRQEAELLVSRSLEVPRSHLYAFEERGVDPAASTRLKDWIRRRADGEPVAYILGEGGFWGLDLEITADVLIPRPETETLVEAALPLIAPQARVLDLGTGSGALALALASERPQATVVATDIDPASMAVCRRNATRLGIEIETHVADCFESLDRRFDVVVSNPPYVDEHDGHLDRGDLRFEPRRALVGGHNGGLDFMARLVGEAPGHLAVGGWLCVEHGYDQNEAVAHLFEGRGFGDIRCHLDIEGRPRVVVGKWGNEVS